MRRRGYALIIISLACANVSLAFLAYWLAVLPIEVTPLMPERGDEQHAEALAQSAVAREPGGLADFEETLARPLFRASRLPAPPPSAAARAEERLDQTESDSSPDNLRLVGMMRLGDNELRALVRSGGEPRASWVGVGGNIGGWRVQAIESNRITVQKLNRRVELEFYSPKTGKTGSE